MDESKYESLCEEVSYRNEQLKLLYNLLIKSQTIIFPTLHLFGLTGTGKTFTVKKFLSKFTNLNSTNKSNVNRFSVYINCNELFYASVSSLFNEILTQIKNSLQLKNFEMESDEINISIREEDGVHDNDNQRENDEDDNSATSDTKLNDCAMFLGRLRRILASKCTQGQNTCLYLVFDNAESLKYFNEASNLLLTLSKLNEYIHIGQHQHSANNLTISTLFLSEIDWHSLISECDLMSKTESPRPFIIYFNEYNKEEMYAILKKTAINLLTIQDQSLNGGQFQIKSIPAAQQSNQHFNVEFYIRVILDVFFPICKDLNEIQYLIQIYYDQLICSVAGSSDDDTNSKDAGVNTYQKMLIAWNKMKPFLKQALTQIYLRQSMFNSTTAHSQSQSSNTDDILKDFENLNILNERSANEVAPSFLNKNQQRISTNQLPKLMKFLLISAYIATHNPAKYDKKLFEYNSTNKSARRSKFTAQKIQQNEENQRAAALKTQSFDVNRLMAIFFALCAENAYYSSINLSQIQLNLKTLKSLHYLQQSNSSYSSLDEPKYKCLIDFETIQNLSNSINFNIKQYLAEYITI
jgi:Cdc6-like AAA superfamily ATPase